MRILLRPVHGSQADAVVDRIEQIMALFGV